MMCRDYGVQLNVNKFEELKLEFLLSLKLQYRCTRWNRMIEVMASTLFLYGAHECFINKFNGKIKIAYDNWLKAQQTHNTKLLENDNIQKAVERAEAEEFRRQIMRKDKNRNQSSW